MLERPATAGGNGKAMLMDALASMGTSETRRDGTGPDTEPPTVGTKKHARTGGVGPQRSDGTVAPTVRNATRRSRPML